jgi:hypothetical protein
MAASDGLVGIYNLLVYGVVYEYSMVYNQTTGGHYANC